MGSTGQIVGAIVGAIISYFIPGLSLVYGMALGYAVGGIIDPATPDISTPGVPDIGQIVMTSTVGDPVPIVLGSAKITGHLLAYGNERTVEITAEQDSGGKGGGGGSTTYVTGHKYYMTWVLGLCTGPVNTLYAIYKGEDVVWEGELNLDDAVNGEETIVIDGIGSCTFYFGTDDQVVNSIIEEIIPNSDYNTPYRNFCYVLMNDCYIGNYSRTPTFHFIVSKIPEFSFSERHSIQKYDCNPAHAIWYILHTVSGLPTSWLNEDTFTSLASSCAQEYRGISLLLVSNQSAAEYIQAITAHIDSILIYGSDGKFHPKVIRNDYDVDLVPSISEDVLVEDPTFTRRNWNDTVNEMKVQYTELITLREKIATYNLFGVGSNTQVGGGGSQLWGYVGGTIGATTPVPLEGLWEKIVISPESYTSYMHNGDNWFAAGSNRSYEFGLGHTDTNLGITELNIHSDTIHTIASSRAPYSTEHTKTCSIKYVVGTSGERDHGVQGDGLLTGVVTIFEQESTFNTFSKVAVGSDHSLALGLNGIIYAVGWNGQLQCGQGWVGGDVLTYSPVLANVEEDIDNDWIDIVAGGYTSYGIKIGGALYGWGQNGVNLGSRFGDGTTDPYVPYPRYISSGWSKFKAGTYQTIGLKEDGTIWGTGMNGTGWAGFSGDISTWTQLMPGSNWIDFAIAGSVSQTGACGLLLNSDGDLYVSGFFKSYPNTRIKDYGIGFQLLDTDVSFIEGGAEHFIYGKL